MLALVEALRIGLKSLIRNPGRSGLTILGLAIGVAAFIAMVSFGDGARRSVVKQFEAFGVNVLTVRQSGAAAGKGAPQDLSDRDVDALRDAPSVEAVVPLRRRTMTLNANGRQIPTIIHGTTPGFESVQSWRFSAGGMFDETDVFTRAKVCILGQTPLRELFGNDDPLGQVVTVDDKLRCRVIGVLEGKGAATSGRDLDDLMLMPATTFHAYAYSGDRGYYRLMVQPRSTDLRDRARQEVVEVLRRTHDLRPEAPDDFAISSPDEATQTVRRVSWILTGLLAGIAGVSLLVGGIGIMNIQLVAVAERTQEIGIRSAIGASPGQILLQFLLEAVLLALVGTVLGAAMGIAIAIVVAQAMNWGSAVPVSAVLGAVAFGAGVGVLFGYLPAQRAARLDPIEALRRE